MMSWNNDLNTIDDYFIDAFENTENMVFPPDGFRIRLELDFLKFIIHCCGLRISNISNFSFTVSVFNIWVNFFPPRKTLQPKVTQVRAMKELNVSKLGTE